MKINRVNVLVAAISLTIAALLMLKGENPRYVQCQLSIWTFKLSMFLYVLWYCTEE